MIAADTSALVSLSAVDLAETVRSEFDVHTTETVIAELEDTAAYDDSHGRAAQHVLEHTDQLQIHDVETAVETSRIDSGEGTVVALAETLEADFLITDDLRALPELQTLVTAQVAISPIVLKALVERDVLDDGQARAKLDALAETRDWLGAPIYRRATRLFQE